MANEPIDEKDFLYGVNVVDIGDLRVSRGLTRRPASACQHARISYCEKERRIWCRDCEHDLEGFDAFVLLVSKYDRALKVLKQRRRDVEEAERFQLRSIAARVIDKAWRSRKMIPACPSCGNGLFPEDFRKDPTMLGRDYAEARRRRQGR